MNACASSDDLMTVVSVRPPTENLTGRPSKHENLIVAAANPVSNRTYRWTISDGQDSRDALRGIYRDNT